jgi:hypothetical protein
MLLVACAFGPPAVTLVACGENRGCIGFYASDASFDSPVMDQLQGCLGFYACDAYGMTCQTPEAGPDVAGDADDAEAAADADADGGE